MRELKIPTKVGTQKRLVQQLKHRLMQEHTKKRLVRELETYPVAINQKTDWY